MLIPAERGLSTRRAAIQENTKKKVDAYRPRDQSENNLESRLTLLDWLEDTNA
jgi:hypothetical protein